MQLLGKETPPGHAQGTIEVRLLASKSTEVTPLEMYLELIVTPNAMRDDDALSLLSTSFSRSKRLAVS